MTERSSHLTVNEPEKFRGEKAAVHFVDLYKSLAQEANSNPGADAIIHRVKIEFPLFWGDIAENNFELAFDGDLKALALIVAEFELLGIVTNRPDLIAMSPLSFQNNILEIRHKN